MTETWKRVTTLVMARDSRARCTDTGARTEWKVGTAEPVRIVLMPSDVIGIPCVTFVAWVGEATSFDPHAVLEHSGRLLEGAVMLRDNVYLFRVTVPSAQLDDIAIARWLDYVAGNATSVRGLRKRIAIVGPDQFAWAL